MAILTVDELRDHVTTDLIDSAVQRLLDATEEVIVARAGAPGSRSEIVDGGGRFITLARPASAVASVTETRWFTTTTLVADDYSLRPGGYVLERLRTGTNPRWHWHGDVSVTYTPIADTSTREWVQIELIKLALTENPGLNAETIGAWSQQYVNNSAWNPTLEQESILSRLDVSLGMVVVR